MPFPQYSGYGNGGSNPYGPGGNAYDNPPPSYGQTYGSHDTQSYNQSTYNHPSNAHEMQNLPPNPHSYNQQQQQQQQPPADPHKLLNECKAITRAISDLEARLPHLRAQQKQYLTSTSVSAQHLQSTSADIMTGYRGLTDRVRRLKGLHAANEPQNAAQVNNTDRRIKTSVQEFQKQEAQFRREVSESQKRQFLIINPEATEAELQQVADAGPDVQLFQQAVMQSSRSGQAQSTLSAVRDRHNAIQQIEQTMGELLQLMQDLDRTIVEQEPLLEGIEQKAVETREHVVAGNSQMETAVTSARQARRKKWMCCGITLLILIIIAVVVAVVVVVMNGQDKQ
ncbi:hypothetical protein MBLNU230_g2591t1 [Neophaeotheca triangularis]